ncbi:TPA: hypothetical protein HA371_00565 [Candidatus Woesearchaeota archaeon]|nr:hypothetical protein [Candidatus Woesearchaeota archaeon]HIJ01691.1 hypothetical protein [Candidatus Woesearchaeota archaeon]HIJ13213.1 hypothetical protein [Candidatus Woesearchaeota archaeon]
MISTFETLKKLFNEIDAVLDKKIKIYILGGAAMMYRNLKDSTKDIDVVMGSDADVFEKALLKIGFRKKKIGLEYQKMNISYILERADFRIDLFEHAVCSKLFLSKNMIRRSENTLELPKLSVNILANEDIFLFKTITEREGDMVDCSSLAKGGIDWKYLLKEIRFQCAHGQDIWITWIAERIDLLEEKGVDIPIINQLHKLVEEYYKKRF